MVKGWNDEVDPLGDLLEFIERVRADTGLPPRYREEAGYYCKVCQLSVTAQFAMWERQGEWVSGPANCPVCFAEFPLLVRERKEAGSCSE